MSRLVLAVAVILCACGGDPDEPRVVCTADLRPGITLTVLDDATGAPASCGARAVITASGYSETVTNPAVPGCVDERVLSGAYERQGQYSVTVSKPGFRDVTLSNLVVGADVCHVITVAATVRLVRL